MDKLLNPLLDLKVDPQPPVLRDAEHPPLPFSREKMLPLVEMDAPMEPGEMVNHLGRYIGNGSYRTAVGDALRRFSDLEDRAAFARCVAQVAYHTGRPEKALFLAQAVNQGFGLEGACRLAHNAATGKRVGDAFYIMQDLQAKAKYD